MMVLGVYQLRAAFGQRWRSYLGIALLVGLLGGVSLVAVAGARRTQSAYPRFLRSARASTMALDPGPYVPEINAAVARLPQVRSSSTYIATNVVPLADGRPDRSVSFEAIGSLDGRFFDQDRFTPTEGRLPDPTRVDEIAVNEKAARQFGYHVGQRIDLGTYTDEQIRDPDLEAHPSPPKLQISATVVGTGLFAEEVLQDESDASALVLFTPAYTEQARPYGTYSWQGLSLKRGDADVDAVKRQLVNLLDPGSPQFFRVTSVDTFHSLQAIRPLTIALGLFGVIAGLATLVLGGQAISRLLRQDRQERTVLRGLGATPRTIAASALIGPVLAILAGGVLAVLFASLASPVAPVGRVRKVEVAAGMDMDLTVLGLGGGSLIALLAAIAAVVSWRESARLAGVLPKRPSSLVAAAAARGMSPAAVAGLRMAFEPGSGRSTVPTRSVMTGAAIAVTALVASLTFGSSLGSLTADHRLYGWSWDATFLDQQGYGNARLDGAHAVLDNNPDIGAWSSAYFGSDLVNGRNVPLLGMAADSEASPPIVSGRGATDPGEVVLGAATAAQLGKGIGDEVSIGAFTPGRQLRIVGIATLPTLGIVHGAHTSLGVGALVAPELVPGFDRNITESKVGGPPPTRVGPNAIFVRFKGGTDVDAAFDRLDRVSGPMASFPGTGTLTRAQRPAEIVNSSEIGGAPSLLAGAMTLGVIASLALALTTSVRRRQRDLALLKAIGFTSRQIGATLAWQATATITVGLVVGVPAGVVVGRGLWNLFAGQLNVVPRPTVPALMLVIISIGLVTIANATAAVPARIARKVQPSVILRSE